MVKVGDFSVELVRADTKEVFKEHTSPVDNRIYAEVEPDIDYLVRVGSNTGDVLCRLLVDGVDLGYNQNFLSPNNSVCAGAFEIKNGKQTMSALHFNKTRDKRHGAMPSMLTGKVEVIFYKIGRKEYKILNDWSSTELTGETEMGGKKCVVSTKGSYVDEIQPIHKVPVLHCYAGEQLCSITVHYCTALGLILNKILDPPPADEPVNIEKKARKRSRDETKASAVSPDEKKAKEANNSSGEMVTVQKTYDLVDLTGEERLI